MTQAFNLSQLANKVNTSGQLDATTGLSGAVPIANLPTITVAKGGTGLTAVGTSGNVLTSNGSAWVSSAPASGGGGRGQVFTSSGTFTVPTGVTGVKVTVIGGGGGGGNATKTSTSGNPSVGGGGGGGGCAIEYVTGLTGGSTVAVTVGAGGTAAGAGGTSSFGAYCSGTGGAAGGSVSGAGLFGAGGAGGTGSGGNLNLSGGAGAPGIVVNIASGYGGDPAGIQFSAYFLSGSGGACQNGIAQGFLISTYLWQADRGYSEYGYGGRYIAYDGTALNGTNGTGYASGGSGGGRDSSGTSSGGVGTAGLVIVEW
jgi:hypothetical protein